MAGEGTGVDKPRENDTFLFPIIYSFYEDS